MFHSKFIKVLEKAFVFYAALALAVFLVQIVGLVMYFFNVWPGIQENFSFGITIFVAIAIAFILIRSCLWIWIYFYGSNAFSILQREEDLPKMAVHLTAVLRTLTRLLIVSCILDLCFVPVIFMSDRLLPFSISGLWLGIIDLSLLLFPQGFGIGALILAFLAHQYGLILKERNQMKEEIELTI